MGKLKLVNHTKEWFYESPFSFSEKSDTKAPKRNGCFASINKQVHRLYQIDVRKVAFFIFAVLLTSIPYLVNHPFRARAAGTTYYVSQAGGSSDSNDGSVAHPWLTVQHAVDTVAAGDIVNVSTGAYDGLTIGNNNGGKYFSTGGLGAEIDPIQIVAVDGDHTVAIKHALIQRSHGIDFHGVDFWEWNTAGGTSTTNLYALYLKSRSSGSRTGLTEYNHHVRFYNSSFVRDSAGSPYTNHGKAIYSDVDYADNKYVEFRNCDFNDGNDLFGSNNLVKDSIFHHSYAGQGIRFAGQNNVFEGNTQREWREQHHGGTINNDAHIDFFQTWGSNGVVTSGNIIRNNLQEDTVQGQLFMGERLYATTYTHSMPVEDNYIYNNVIIFGQYNDYYFAINTKHNIAGDFGYGSWPERYVDSLHVYNNTLIGTDVRKPTLVTLEGGYNHVVANNVMDYCGVGYVTMDGVTTVSYAGNNLYRSCDYVMKTINLSGNQSSTSLVPNPGDLWNTDPLFVDKVNRDFTLSSGSPAIDAGNDTYASTTDKNGQSRVGTSDMGAYEYFAETPPITYSVVYRGNGNTSGSPPVDSNAYLPDATVTVLGDSGNLARDCYSFAGWNTSADGSGTDRAPASTFAMPSADTYLYAKWTPGACTLTYTADLYGSLTGSTTQTVNLGENGTAVNAVPDMGYHFEKWSDESTANPRTDMTVQTSAIITALFDINTYSLTYTSGAHGSITGTTSQTVAFGGTGTEVTAVADTGYHFVDWSDDSTENPRTDSSVTSDVTVTANFAITEIVPTYDITDHDEEHTEGGVTLEFVGAMPVGATGVNVSVTSADTTSHALPSGKDLIRLYDVAAENQDEDPVTSGFVAHVVLDYPAGDAAEEEEYAVMYWNGTSWSSVGITNVASDTTNNKISFNTTHFSEFGIFQTKPSEVTTIVNTIVGGNSVLPIAGGNALLFSVTLALSYVFILEMNRRYIRRVIREAISR